MPDTDLDFSVLSGGMGCITALTEAGTTFLAENVDYNEYQCAGGTLLLNGDCLMPILQGALADDLVCAYNGNIVAEVVPV